MKRMAQAAAAVVVLGTCLAGWGRAQQPAAAPAGGVLIAVIDIGYVFDHHPGFKQQIEQIKQQVQAFEAHTTQRREEIVKKSEQLKQLKPGSPDYKRLEAEIARQMTDLQVDTQLKRKEVLDQEAKSYYQAYTDVLAAVQAVAARYGIGLVLRYDRSEIDPTDRASVLRGLNRSVVVQRNLDISDLVLQQLTSPRMGAVPPTRR